MANKEKKTARFKITKKMIDGIKRPKKGQFFLRDIALLGFGVRFTPGSTSFILEKRIKGRMRRISLGPYGGLTLEDAQNKAKRMIGEIASGKDPAEDRLEQKREPTFGDLIEAYKEHHLPRKKSAKNDELQIGAHLDGWKNRKLSAITRKEVSRLHLDLGEKSGPYAANRVVALLRKMFNLGQIWGMFKGENPATGIGMFPEKKRERFVHPDELPRLMEALKGEENFYIRTVFLVCMFTGARKGEVLSMRWEDVDLAQGLWRIPETKAGRSHLVPLPAPVIEILRNLPHAHNNAYVFPGRKGKHLVSVNKSWNEIRTKAGLKDVRIHDLRRTVGSWLAGSGASLPLIGKVLNHSQPATTQIYARLDIELVRAALEANAARMLQIAEEAESQK